MTDLPRPVRVSQMAPLEAVQRSAAAYANARDKRDNLIRAARAAGHPLRAIATAAGVSVETVRTITRKG